MLSREPDLAVIGEFERSDEVLVVCARDPEVVVVLDPLVPGEIEMLELCGRLDRNPVLMLIDRDDSASVPVALAVAKQSESVGVIATDVSPDDLVDAVRGVAEGRSVFDVELALAAIRAGGSPLTQREREVLRLIDTGATVQEIARSLSLSAGTIRNYLSRILAKTRARSRIEAIRKAQEAGWF
ncbi:response regulator transcription factor [Kribbella sp. CA-293567]|uniref:response regulator transcription factor n=1 Tax=Kribbella sp. CA-293567 TaxID=3002436 RepID=UPI0022DD31BA|nr:response regulator transcription factor [Kribbella sp. CA-293567]WBQ08239.1 response regulator transcription factor [Kribbella sp. CA-293567]